MGHTAGLEAGLRVVRQHQLHRDRDAAGNAHEVGFPGPEFPFRGEEEIETCYHSRGLNKEQNGFQLSLE
jgi:hypothetical protein